MFSSEKIKGLIEAAIPSSMAEVRDYAGDQDHFELKVVSTAFEGKGLVERHRMVYSALGAAMQGPIHALSIKAVTPEEEKRS